MAVALVVEDEWLVRMEIADALDAAGWIILEANTGEAALALVDHSPKINLVVTDIRLPGPASGWDVADAFRAADPKTAVIYCSGNPRDERRQVSESVFLTKPCRMDMLVATSRRLCSDAAPVEKRTE